MTADDVMTLSGDEADAVIAGYDDTTGGWTFDLFGNFWNTVQHAWGNGLNGDKSRIAILDTCPDLKRG